MQLHLKIFDGFLVNIHVIDSLPLFYHDLKIITNSLRNLFFVPFTHYINLYQWVKKDSDYSIDCNPERLSVIRLLTFGQLFEFFSFSCN